MPGFFQADPVADYEDLDDSESSDFIDASAFSKMVFVVNTQLNMGVGKIAAQVCILICSLSNSVWCACSMSHLHIHVFDYCSERETLSYKPNLGVPCAC